MKASSQHCSGSIQMCFLSIQGRRLFLICKFFSFHAKRTSVYNPGILYRSLLRIRCGYKGVQGNISNVQSDLPRYNLNRCESDHCRSSQNQPYVLIFCSLNFSKHCVNMDTRCVTVL